ncbi:MAG: hypothetical protein AB8B69_09205 [Chitinophagales bacterium]
MSEALKKSLHTVYIGSMTLIVIATTVYLSYVGYTYYATPLEERFYSPNHDWFKPSGAYGHGLGIVGTLMILFGVVIYILRKRYNLFSSFIRLKYLLEFHIFLCLLGPILVLFHTAFKFGGIVSIAFWSMVAVVASGFIGRFIYVQIPHNVEGKELTLEEVKKMKDNLQNALVGDFKLDDEISQMIVDATKDPTQGKKASSFTAKYFADRKTLAKIHQALKQKQFLSADRKAILKVVKDELSLANKMSRLQTMKTLFKYWHVAHLPFALIMLIIVVVHVGVTFAFGYKWIF